MSGGFKGPAGASGGPAAAGAGESPPPPAGAAAPAQSLAQALASQCIASDRALSVMVVCVHLATLARGTLVRHEVLLLAVLVAAFVGTWAAAALARRRYLAVRTPLVVLLRLAQFAALPLIADVMRVMEPEGVMVSEAAAGGGGGGGRAAAALGAAARLVRAVLLLVMGVGWLHGSAVAALGMQLPPAAHLLVQGVTTLLLCRRATPVCHQFVGSHPRNARVSAAAYEAAQHLTSMLCLGTWSHMAAAADASSDAQKCVATVWSLQASLGLVLPTLIVWRAQLRAAGKFVSGQRDAGREAAAEEELRRSQYTRLCTPALQAADMLGWAATTGLAGLWAFVGAVLWHWHQTGVAAGAG